MRKAPVGCVEDGRMTKNQSRCHGNHCDSCHQLPPVLIPDLKIKSQPPLQNNHTHSLILAPKCPTKSIKITIYFYMGEQHSNPLSFARSCFSRNGERLL